MMTQILDMTSRRNLESVISAFLIYLHYSVAALESLPPASSRTRKMMIAATRAGYW